MMTVTDFKVTMLLADAAQEVDGKLYILGGGWSITGPGPATFAVAVQIQTPWDRANMQHTFRLELLDADGQAVTFPTPDGQETGLAIEGAFEVGRPPGLKAGTPLDGAFARNFAGLPLDPASRFEWRLSINGQTREEWTLPFTTRPAAAEQAA
jgi:hypothetical protein